MEPETLGYRVLIENVGMLERIRRGEFTITTDGDGAIFPTTGKAWGAWSKYSNEYEHGHQSVSLVRVFESRVEERRVAEFERRSGDRRG